MVGAGWANSHPGCLNRPKKHHSHLLVGSFLAGKASWVQRVALWGEPKQAVAVSVIDGLECGMERSLYTSSVVQSRLSYLPYYDSRAIIWV